MSENEKEVIDEETASASEETQTEEKVSTEAEAANEQEEKLGVQLKAGKPLALIKEKEYVNILKFLKKGK